MIRYKIDVRGDIVAIETKIASNRRTAGNTLNANTAQIADATLPALERRLAELRAELEQVEERPQLACVQSFRFTERTTPLTDAENDSLEIPAFLRRTK